jgi:hypothetical protein
LEAIFFRLSRLNFARILAPPGARAPKKAHNQQAVAAKNLFILH